MNLKALLKKLRLEPNDTPKHTRQVKYFTGRQPEAAKKVEEEDAYKQVTDGPLATEKPDQKKNAQKNETAAPSHPLHPPPTGVALDTSRCRSVASTSASADDVNSQKKSSLHLKEENVLILLDGKNGQVEAEAEAEPELEDEDDGVVKARVDQLLKPLRNFQSNNKKLMLIINTNGKITKEIKEYPNPNPDDITFLKEKVGQYIDCVSLTTNKAVNLHMLVNDEEHLHQTLLPVNHQATLLRNYFRGVQKTPVVGNVVVFFHKD